MSKWNARTLCRLAILAALYTLLSLVTIQFGNVKITFAPLPVVVSAMLFGPWEAAIVGFFGEFLDQMLGYGFTATTILWLIPPAIRGVIIGAAAVACRRGKTDVEPAAQSIRYLERRPVTCYVVSVAAALVTTLTNTAVIWLDSVIYGYYTPAYVFGDMVMRLVTGVITAVVLATVAMPVVAVLRKNRIGK